MSLHFCCASRFPTGLPQMSSIDDLLSQISDTALKAKLETEINKLTKHKKFGLVFEEHLPERTPLFGITVKKNSRVALKTSKTTSEVFRVLDIKDGMARCKKTDSEEIKEFSVNDLVPIAEFGEPIYPYLKPIDSVCNGDENEIWHTLIEADNYHALQLLEYLYPGKVDCIYIDPPYNTGARDWKYNNDYVDGNDTYRHSKWLSMMQKRLKLAKKLLNPKDSVLIVTIDEKEYLHLGCLLEEMFPEARMQMVSSVINPSGVSREGEFYRTDEYIFFLKFGRASPSPLALTDEWITARSTGKDKLRWRPIRRQGSNDSRQDAPNQFFPIFLSADGKHFSDVGLTLPTSMSWTEYKAPKDRITIWPLKPDGSEGCWQISQESFLKLCKRGYTRISYTKKWGYVPQYLAEGERRKVENGQFPILGRAEDGSIITDEAIEEAPFIPGTQWRIHSHSAREFGSTLINTVLSEKRFSFPKSLYAVCDALRFFVKNKTRALILDFFAGSGTTLHAVNLLNAEDGGKRRCIMVTNNEVSEAEAKTLTKHGHQPGDEDWEKLGIARHVTWPRSVCSIEGHDVNGNPLKGNYIGSGRSMADGFKANVAFFKLGFLDKTSVALGRQFKEMLPTLWLKAGAYGICPEVDEKSPAMMILPQNKMAILLDETAYPRFEEQVRNNADIQTVFIVTDSESGYREMITSFSGKTTYQLYRDYLDNFRINTGR